MLIRRGAVLALALLALGPSLAQAHVRVAQSATGSPGDYATLAVAVTPSATCSITVLYKSGASEARGLETKRGSAISWTWKIGTRTTPGRWPIYLDCGRAGRLTTSIRVA